MSLIYQIPTVVLACVVGLALLWAFYWICAESHGACFVVVPVVGGVLSFVIWVCGRGFAWW
jgi:hypothetical protein